MDETVFFPRHASAFESPHHRASAEENAVVSVPALTELLDSSIRLLGHQLAQVGVLLRRDLVWDTATTGVTVHIAAFSVASQQSRDRRFANLIARCKLSIRTFSIQVRFHDSLTQVERQGHDAFRSHQLDHFKGVWV